MADEEQGQDQVSPLSEPELLVEEDGTGPLTEVIETAEEEMMSEPATVFKRDVVGVDSTTNGRKDDLKPQPGPEEKQATEQAVLDVSEDTDDAPSKPESVEVAVTELPTYLESDEDVVIQTVCIQTYERRSTATFPKEEYYAFKVVTMVGVSVGTQEDDSEVAVVVPDEQKKTKWEVWRRYSEFEFLKSFFALVYPHAIIPPIPEKKLQGSSGILSKIAFGEDVDFLTRRRRALEIFLVRVNRHPVLKTNVWFHRFLNDQDNWKDDMVATGFQSQADSRLKMLAQVLSNHKPDMQFLDILNYSVDLRSALESLVLNRERMNAHLVPMYQGYTTLGKTLSEMACSEKLMGDQLQQTAGLLDSYASTVATYVEEEELRYLLPIKEYIAFCDSLKAVVGRQEQVQLEYDKAEDDVIGKADVRERLEKEKLDQESGQGGFKFKKLFKFGSQPSIDERLSVLKAEMTTMDGIRKEKMKKLKAFNKAALEEFENFNTQKIADFRSVLINFAYLQIQLHKKGLSSWERVKAANVPQK
jgi:sorting nexin-4